MVVQGPFSKDKGVGDERRSRSIDNTQDTKVPTVLLELLRPPLEEAEPWPQGDQVGSYHYVVSEIPNPIQHKSKDVAKPTCFPRLRNS